MEDFMELPDLNKEVACKIEYVHDYLENGDHDQRCGDYWIKVKRVECDVLGWKWVPVSGEGTDFDGYPDFCKKEMLEWLDECSGDEGYGLEWAHEFKDLKSNWKDSDGYY